MSIKAGFKRCAERIEKEKHARNEWGVKIVSLYLLNSTRYRR